MANLQGSHYQINVMIRRDCTEANSMNIKIKYFTDAIDRLAYIDGKSDWIDLRAAREVVLKKGDFALIPLGVAMELPKAMRRM